MQITNLSNLSLPIAVWLLHDNYDYINDPNYVSATSLLRPTKQIILAKQVLAEDKTMDLTERISASVGNALHDSLQGAWEDVDGRSDALRRLGYPDRVIQNIVINPTDEEISANPNIIPVWIEYRAFREINGYKIGGKLDFAASGELFDFKSTSVYTYLKGRKDEDYRLQGSIYKWLSPDKITGSHMYIQFIFTDWQRFMTFQNEDYPKNRILSYPVELLSMDQIEKFISNKLSELDRLWLSDESELPDCTDEELWRGETQYKYFSKAENKRSTKNFENDKAEAYAYLSEKGVGIIKEIPGEVKACAYCPAYSKCKQKDQYNV